jgi:hypothetical protein
MAREMITNLGKVNHLVGVILLGTRVRVREQRVDPGDPGELYAGVAGLEVSARLEAEVLPRLRDGAEVALCDAPREVHVGQAAAAVLLLGGTCGRCNCRSAGGLVYKFCERGVKGYL